MHALTLSGVCKFLVQKRQITNSQRKIQPNLLENNQQHPFFHVDRYSTKILLVPFGTLALKLTVFRLKTAPLKRLRTMKLEI